jgi:hypothetical protein
MEEGFPRESKKTPIRAILLIRVFQEPVGEGLTFWDIMYKEEDGE